MDQTKETGSNELEEGNHTCPMKNEESKQVTRVIPQLTIRSMFLSIKLSLSYKNISRTKTSASMSQN